ncbi:nucleic acid binding protein [Gaillardia latent virus]|uniref:RNA silencing suppressor n=1 Tax=Gaillardia latent virus TaxID=1468172 RepID=X2KTS7_9VIRU|nr:nucleic acid binding protein [Gaillardia latent virus]AHN84516.1 nucleic acid binding protein [Gaillardia latent virus]
MNYDRIKSEVMFLLLSKFLERGSAAPLPIVFSIYVRAFNKRVGNGTSAYARRRRAVSIGRCHRCYRVYPPLWFSKKCDNRTCVPGISFNHKVQNYILWGVTEVIPHPGYNF